MGDLESALQGAREHGTLSLCYQGLTALPPMVPGLLTLQRLDLGHNGLRTLPPLGALAALVGAAEPAQAKAAAAEALPTLRKLEAEWRDFDVAWPLLRSASLSGGQQGLVVGLSALGAL